MAAKSGTWTVDRNAIKAGINYDALYSTVPSNAPKPDPAPPPVAAEPRPAPLPSPAPSPVATDGGYAPYTGSGGAGLDAKAAAAKAAQSWGTETQRAAYEKQREKAVSGYARTATGAVDYTRLANGAPSGLDSAGRVPYNNDGSVNPHYTGATVPGQVGVPDASRAPAWTANVNGLTPETAGLNLSGGGDNATTWVPANWSTSANPNASTLAYGKPDAEGTATALADPATGLPYAAGGWRPGGGTTPPVAPTKASSWDPTSQSYVFADGTKDVDRNASGNVPNVAPSAAKPMADAIKTAAKYLDNLATARAHTTDKEAQAKLDRQIKEWSKRIADYRSRP